VSGSESYLTAGAPDPERIVTVLTIGESGEDRDSLRSILRHSNWTIHEAGSREEGSNLLRRQRVAVVLCDAHLPDGGWKGVLESLETIEKAPLLIVTAWNADEQLWAEVLSLGAFDLLPKPFDHKEVVRVVGFAWLHWKEAHTARRHSAAARA
jgi:DNA-binding response OmpR family regulator